MAFVVPSVRGEGRRRRPRRGRSRGPDAAWRRRRCRANGPVLLRVRRGLQQQGAGDLQRHGRAGRSRGRRLQVVKSFNGSTRRPHDLPHRHRGRGDVYVAGARPAAQPSSRRPISTMGPGWFNGDDAVVLGRAARRNARCDRPDRRRPGTEWGSGLATTADNTCAARRRCVSETSTAATFRPLTGVGRSCHRHV